MAEVLPVVLIAGGRRESQRDGHLVMTLRSSDMPWMQSKIVTLIQADASGARL